MFDDVVILSCFIVISSKKQDLKNLSLKGLAKKYEQYFEKDCSK